MSNRTKLFDRFYIGSKPNSSLGFDVVVLTAEEYQPPAKKFSGMVIRLPLHDDVYPLTKTEKVQIKAVVAEITRLWFDGKSILVTCYMGRNRSALVSTLALSKITGRSLREVSAHVRRTRRDALGVPALQNSYFWGLLQH